MAVQTEDPFVFLEKDEFKPPQPRFLFEQEQGPVQVEFSSPDPNFNPQEINPVGDPDHDMYPAFPVIEWIQFGYRDPSQSIKVPNTGATNITPRAALDQQTGRQSPPVLYPNQTVQAPTPWDDLINLMSPGYPSAAPSAEAARVKLAQAVASFNPAVVQ
jgi:hypothetical protein